MSTETTQLLEENSTQLPLLPLKNVVMLPKSIIPIIVGRSSSIHAVEASLKADRMLFITTQKDAETEKPTADDLFTVGTRSTILQIMRMPNGALKIIAEGICRAHATQFHGHDNSFHTVTVEDIATSGDSNPAEVMALWRKLHELYTIYSSFNEKAPVDIVSHISSVADIDHATDAIAMHITTFSVEERQQLLELSHLIDRMAKLYGLIDKEVEILKAEQKIQGRIQTQVDKSQREYYLNEQLKAINKELGRDEYDSDVEQFKKRLNEAALPKETRQKVEKEIRRIEQMPPTSAEAMISRNYVDWILSLPWNNESKDTISLTQAEKILNGSHAGLKKAKERIVEFLAAKKFAKQLSRSPVICLIGPPGVGKTSLARSIAKSLGREFIRIALGGVRDEAEIRGHRRTYIGALPGKIIHGMKRSGTTNPVILLDEIDKMSRDLHGDPAAALLEVLDPEQNRSFVDHFLDIEYDLSKVMFIATANVIEHIPYPLLDRLEIIHLSGYTEKEKLQIAKQFLIPKSLNTHGLTQKQCMIPDAVVQFIITNYTKEAGVRQLERLLEKVMRKSIQRLLKRGKDRIMTITVTIEMVRAWFGYAPFRKTSINTDSSQPGLATGLAWTEVGGDILEIETAIVPGKGSVTLTGQLGEVMQESAQAALSYIRSRTKELGLAASFHTNKDIHLHVPEGSTPKDGPSAGITMCTALVSALIKKPVKPHVAMTGEITLQGRVLAVGGLKEKLLAAKLYHVSTVIVPEENREEVEEAIRETGLDDLSVIFVSTMDDVINAAFEKSPLNSKTVRKNSSRKRKLTKK